MPSEDAFRIGVTLALQGGIGPQIEKLVREFQTMDAAINRATESLGKLSSATAGLAAHARQASAAYREMASSAERVARASRGIAAGGGGGPAASGGLIRLPSYGPSGGALVPYRSSSRDYTTQGNPYTPYGQYGVTPQRRGPGALVPYAPGGGPGGPGTGFTLNGGPYDPRGSGGALVPYSPEGAPQIPLSYRPDRLPADHRYMMGPGSGGGDPLAGVGTAYVGLNAVKQTISEAAQYQKQLATLKAQVGSQEAVDRASKAAFAIQQSVAGSTVPGNIALLGDLMATTQNFEESIKLLPAFAKLAVQLGQFGKGGESELRAAIKGAEESGSLGKVGPDGVFNLNEDKLQRYINTVIGATVITRGAVDPEQILQFQRAANWVGATVDPSVLIPQNIALIQSLGASGAGRGVFATEQQWAAGQMSQAALKLATDPALGLVKGGQDIKHNPYVTVKGLGTYVVSPQGFEPGVQEQLRTDPQGFLGVLMGKLDNYLSQKIKGFDQMSPEQRAQAEIAYGSAISSRDPARAYLAQVLELKGLIDRDKIAIAKQMQEQTQQFLTDQNATVQMQAFAAALQAFKIAAGSTEMQQVIAGLNSLSGALNTVSTWTGQHAEATKVGLDAVTAGLSVLGAGAIVKFALALGPVPALLAAVAAGTVGMTAAFQALDHWLKSAFPNVFTNKGLEDIKAHPIVKPWWMPGSGEHEPTPPLVKRLWHEFGIGSAEGATVPAAPMPGTSSPIRVHIDGGQVNANISNTHDLMHGISSGQANMMNLPPSGTLSHDPRMSAGQAPWIGVP